MHFLKECVKRKLRKKVDKSDIDSFGNDKEKHMYDENCCCGMCQSVPGVYDAVSQLYKEKFDRIFPCDRD